MISSGQQVRYLPGKSTVAPVFENETPEGQWRGDWELLCALIHIMPFARYFELVCVLMLQIRKVCA